MLNIARTMNAAISRAATGLVQRLYVAGSGSSVTSTGMTSGGTGSSPIATVRDTAVVRPIA
ncbi:MAG TPA: hypothetical protein VNZ57_03255 [Longimicrobiales bacterium]|nr:hypothetical protein [Longimicrobiales bacterium]